MPTDPRTFLCFFAVCKFLNTFIYFHCVYSKEGHIRGSYSVSRVKPVFSSMCILYVIKIKCSGQKVLVQPIELKELAVKIYENRKWRGQKNDIFSSTKTSIVQILDILYVLVCQDFSFSKIKLHPSKPNHFRLR